MSKLIKIHDVLEQCAISRTSLYHQIKCNQFPKPIKVMSCGSRWLQSEIDEWIEERAAEREN